MPFIAYKITHRESGKAYVGVTTQRRPQLRWHYHKTLGRPGIGAAIQKYGATAFDFEVIAQSTTLDDLIALEIILIEQENSIAPFGYNLNGGGRGHFKVHAAVRAALSERNRTRVWSEESRAKVSAANSGRKMPVSHTEKRSAYMTGRRLSEETKAKLSEMAKLRHNDPNWRQAIRQNNAIRPVSAETKAKISAGVSRYAASRVSDIRQSELL